MDGSFNRINTREITATLKLDARMLKRLDWEFINKLFSSVRWEVGNKKIFNLFLTIFYVRKLMIHPDFNPANSFLFLSLCPLNDGCLRNEIFLITFHSFWLISTRFAFFSLHSFLLSFNYVRGDSTVVSNNTNALNICAE